MDLFVVASFVGFFAMVLAWLAAPSSSKRTVVLVEPSIIGAD